MNPFLLVSTRPDEEALDSEYQAYLRATGLDSEQLDLAEFDLIGLPPIDLSRYRGVFVAGSPYGNATVDGKVSHTQRWVGEELRVLFQQILDTDIPCLATGTAMTILGQTIGATVGEDHAELASIAEITLTSEGRQDPLLEGMPEDFFAYVSHTESCEELPEGAHRLAWSLHCPIQMFRHGKYVYATQFNPELDAEAIQRQLEAYADAGDFGIGDADMLVGTGRHTEGNHLAGRILRQFVKYFGS
ncbi:glutamine amidotransferase [Actinomycetaceae bacterium WB03_NA08]|uniref:Glutamine amidotransferase n=1 Tax=Scrofimicrobium canadense TaxID=2652290 RepID=A0A6N7W5A9_9ACTO|nr:glutamine amidotransferase [Scrofimicrobium canadense]MSS83318.1 glutamine amidotransferase [Scrofimicrobium canadense]